MLRIIRRQLNSWCPASSAQRLGFIVVLFIGVEVPVIACAGAMLCDQAATQAARHTGVPVNVLKALTRTETGRRKDGVFAPWPWSMNVEGKGKWFASQAEAELYLAQVTSTGNRNFDVGCFQINYRWHGEAFETAQAMFDPKKNAIYAARFLQRLFEEKGNWTDAAAAYHSRTPKYATRYKARFERILSDLKQDRGVAVALAESEREYAKRQNSFPLLQQQNTQLRSFGSLVPIVQTGQRAFLALGG